VSTTELEKIKAKYGPNVGKDVNVAMQYREEVRLWPHHKPNAPHTRLDRPSASMRVLVAGEEDDGPVRRQHVEDDGALPRADAPVRQLLLHHQETWYALTLIQFYS
jgi:hypothetical protein